MGYWVGYGKVAEGELGSSWEEYDRHYPRCERYPKIEPDAILMFPMEDEEQA